jgi:hypothetical protein
MNIYWPTFKNLENEFSRLMYDIHIDDEQLKVYSSKISDLILRAAVEIESIAKEIYFREFSTAKTRIRYDDAIDSLCKTWLLNKKPVQISSVNCFLSQTTLYPFVKSENRTGTEKKTYSWNNAYQNIKHDRAGGMKYGNLKSLFEIMAALYILNLYFANRNYPLRDDSAGRSLSSSFGSDIFSVKVYYGATHDNSGVVGKDETFNESVYFIEYDEETQRRSIEYHVKFQEEQSKIILQDPIVIEYLTKFQNAGLTPPDNWYIDLVGMDGQIKLIRELSSILPYPRGHQYEAKLNTSIFAG